MAHMTEKWSEEGKGTEKWCKILVIAEGKMSLSWDAVSRWNWKNEMRKEVYSKMLKKRQQKLSMRICDGVVVREWMEYKSHHHVYESRTFSKRPTWCKLAITPIRRALTESSRELILEHNLQTLTTRIVKKLYPRNPKHIRNKLQCDKNACTLTASKENRYWTINPVHIGVKILDKHEGTSDWDIT